MRLHRTGSIVASPYFLPTKLRDLRLAQAVYRKDSTHSSKDARCPIDRRRFASFGPGTTSTNHLTWWHRRSLCDKMIRTRKHLFARQVRLTGWRQIRVLAQLPHSESFVYCLFLLFLLCSLSALLLSFSYNYLGTARPMQTIGSMYLFHGVLGTSSVDSHRTSFSASAM